MSTFKIHASEKSKKFFSGLGAPMQDAKLSLKAKGLAASLYLLQQQGEEITVEKLLKISPKNGETQVYSGLRELIKRGYLVREVTRNNEGKFEGTYYQVYPKGRQI